MARVYQAPTYQNNRVYPCDVRNSQMWVCKDFIIWLKENGMSYEQFKTNGIPFALLEATDNLYAHAAVEMAKKRQKKVEIK